VITAAFDAAFSRILQQGIHNNMVTEKQVQDNIKEIILDVMAVLYEHNIKEIHMGAMMRLLGVDETTAAEYDQDRITLSDAVFELIDWADELESPPGAALH
jgi:hypothetical protein